LNGAPVTPPVLLGYAALVGGVVLVAERGLAEQRLAALPLWSLALLLLAIPAVVYATIASTLSALLLIAAWFVVVLWCDGVLLRRERWWLAWFARLLLALLAGGVPVAIGQLESRFADEEFFVALEALALAVVWLLVRAACCSLVGPSHPHRLPRRHRRLGLLYLLVCAFVGAAGLVGAYQRSFYPATAPAFGRITPAAPFACREVAPDPTTYDGQATFARMLERVEANPNKDADEWGLLAVGTGESARAQRFRAELLAEARRGLFTGPANSMKTVQHSAATRIYYYLRAKAVFPDLFSPADEAELRAWFYAINRRAQTVEWVDWLYALAFASWPAGPYANQESGAGLLAILEHNGLGDPALREANRAYLADHGHGWRVRFRNTDDAPIYQPEWIRNAFLQAEYGGVAHQRNRALAFEWLLLHTLPDGTPLRLNHPGLLSAADWGGFGAALLDDARYTWLTGRGLDGLTKGAPRRYLSAQVGMDLLRAGPGRSPEVGSCLLYGDSGLPNQRGPLAPDKIVFRDGWDEQATYLMLNLRFTGWHRYKATNSLSLLYGGRAYLRDALGGPKARWLPEGRSLLRDKRLGREQLNGLLVERTGMSAALYRLTGLGGPWAQDPPYYARVDQWRPGVSLDVSSTLLEGWRGWSHRRTIYFHHNGPVVILDRADGPPGLAAAVRWHAAGTASATRGRIAFDDGAELALVPLATGPLDITTSQSLDNQAASVITLAARPDGRLRAATVLLRGRWAGATITQIERNGRPNLRIVQGGDEVVVPLDAR
jgi:hypothetical protein